MQPPLPKTAIACFPAKLPTVDFRGQRRKNNTHRSTTDSEARLAKRGKGKEAKLCYEGHVLAENRNGLITQCELTKVSGTSERETVTRLSLNVNVSIAPFADI